MNTVRRIKYQLEFDVWEATQKKAEAEIDGIITFITQNSSHLGHLKLTRQSEDRLDGHE